MPSDLTTSAARAPMHRPGLQGPLWTTSRRPRVAPAVRGEVRADVVVVGAGITGLTAGWLLQSQGLDVVLVEAEAVGAGTTGASSAHVTSVLDVSYRDLRRSLGVERARLVVAACEGALDLVRSLGQGAVACSFVGCPAYRYAESLDRLAELEAELDAARDLGVAATLLDGAPVPFPVRAALLFPDQAVFDPMAYVDGLADLFTHAGGRLYLGSRVRSVEETQGGVTLETEEGVVRAAFAVLATHTPLGINIVHADLVPYRSYLLAFRSPARLPFGLFWDCETPYHYLRALRLEGETLALVGGCDHRAGHEVALVDRYRQLEEFARERFPGVEVVRRWSSDLYQPADGLPYVGRSPLTERIFVGAGYGGAGLVLGTLAAQIIAELVVGQPESELACLLQAARVPSPRAVGQAALGGLDVELPLVRDRLDRGGVDLQRIGSGQGRLVSIDGETLAVSRDDAGCLHAVSGVCTHMGYVVHWNDAERTWDCPCHGGSYSADGRVLTGPPLEDLEPRPLPQEAAVASAPADDEKGSRRG